MRNTFSAGVPGCCFFRRITIIVFVLLFFLSSFFVSASAADYEMIDPSSYRIEKYDDSSGAHRIIINGNNRLTGGATIINGTTKYFSGTSVTTNTSSTFRLYWYPFGSFSRANIKSIKSGSTFKVRWFLYESSDDYFIGSAEFGVEFFDDSNKSLGAQWFSNTVANGYEYSAEFTWSPPSGAVSAYFISRTSWTYSSGSVSYKWQITSFEIDYELAYDPDDPFAGQIDPVPPGSGELDDFTNTEDGIENSVSPWLDPFGDFVSGAQQGLTSFASGFNFLAQTVDYFLTGGTNGQDMNFVTFLIEISIVLGSFGFLIGLGVTIVKHSGKDGDD